MRIEMDRKVSSMRGARRKSANGEVNDGRERRG
jgi:hypothetical protein